MQHRAIISHCGVTRRDFGHTTAVLGPSPSQGRGPASIASQVSALDLEVSAGPVRLLAAAAPRAALLSSVGHRPGGAVGSGTQGADAGDFERPRPPGSIG